MVTHPEVSYTPQVQSRTRTIDRRGLALACTQAGAVLTEFEKQQLWGILANADDTATNGDDGSTRGHSGWVVRGGEVRRLRRWMTLEPSRGRLLFMDKEGGRAIDFIELSQCSTVYEATAVRRRAVAERVLGLERLRRAGQRGHIAGDQ